MSLLSDFEHALDAIIYPGFPDDAAERAKIVDALVDAAETALPRACQSIGHSSFMCRYGGMGNDQPLWQCAKCRRWVCYAELTGDDEPTELCVRCRALGSLHL